jgi:hypothetical protein
MQNNDLTKKTVTAVAVAILLGANLAFAAKTSPVDLAKKELRSVPTAEMPAKAASLVGQAKPEAAEATAETVVTAAVELKSAAAVAVVSAIARQNNDLAPAAAAKAASLRPKEAAVIARAAAGAAPTQAAKIVYAVCKVVPDKYTLVATAVAQVAPSAAKEILAAVTSAVPALKPFVERATSRDQNEPVGVIMAQTESLVNETARFAKISAATIIASTTPAYGPLPPPQPGPPFTPYSGSPTELNHNATIEIPPGGGRNYFGP